MKASLLESVGLFWSDRLVSGTFLVENRTLNLKRTSSTKGQSRFPSLLLLFSVHTDDLSVSFTSVWSLAVVGFLTSVEFSRSFTQLLAVCSVSTPFTIQSSLFWFSSTSRNINCVWLIGRVGFSALTCFLTCHFCPPTLFLLQRYLVPGLVQTLKYSTVTCKFPVRI